MAFLSVLSIMLQSRWDATFHCGGHDAECTGSRADAPDGMESTPELMAQPDTIN